MPEKLKTFQIEEIKKTYENISAQFDKVFKMLKDKENIIYIDASGTVDEVAEKIRGAVLQNR